MADDAAVGAVRQALGSELDADEIQRIATTSAAWDADPGELLVAEGHVASQGYIVVRGSATVTVGGATVARLGPGSLIWAGTDWGAMPAKVVADEPTWLLLLSPEVLRRLGRVPVPIWSRSSGLSQ